MTFSMAWGFPPVVALPGELPVPVATIYYNADLVSGGTGTFADPYGGALPGTSIGHTYISAGTRIVCKGTLNSTGANFGLLHKGGSAANPVVYVGNDPGWGDLVIDGSKVITPVACTSSGDAFGNTNWANLKKADITATVGLTAEDYRHCLYTGDERNIQYLAGYPLLANADAVNYKLYCPCTTTNDIFYPAPPAGAATAQPRISLVDANVAMGFGTGFLQGVIDSNAMPIVQMRIRPNQWYTAVMERCNADLSVNAAGDYLKPIAGSDVLTASAVGYALSEYKFRILNIPQAINGAGQYVINPPLGWILGWPEAGSPVWRRGQGKSGLSVNNNNIWLHGIQFSGMSNSVTTGTPAGAGGGNSIEVETSVDSKTVVIQRCKFYGFGSYGFQSRQQSYDYAWHAKRYYNTYKGQMVGSAIEVGWGAGAVIKYCSFDKINGSNIRIIGGVGATYAYQNHRDILIEGNHIRNCNDLHGNGITIYTCKFSSFVIRGNLIQNTGRPLTSEHNTAYAAGGTPECIIEYNTFLASGYGTSAALRLQDGAELGIIVRNNKLYGNNQEVSPFGELEAIGCEPTLSTSLNGPWTDNITVGATPSGTPAAFLTAGSGNVNTLYGSGGAALVAAWNALTAPEVTYAPLGAGHTAGGWDGLH